MFSKEQVYIHTSWDEIDWDTVVDQYSFMHMIKLVVDEP